MQAELDKALKDIEVEKQLRRRAEIHASELKLQCQSIKDELNKYKKIVAEFESQKQNPLTHNLPQTSASIFEKPTGIGNISFSLEKLIQITEVIL